MRRLLLAAVLLLGLHIGVTAQVQLQSYIGLIGSSEIALDVKGLSDGGAVMVGYTTVLDPSGNYDYTTSDALITRVDASGNVLWTKILGTASYDDKFTKVVVAQNGDFIVSGYAGHTPQGTAGPAGSAMVYRFNGSGLIQFSNFIDAPSGSPGDKGSIFFDLTELANGDVVAVGTRDFRPNASGGLVTYFNASLSPIWSRAFTTSGSDELHAVANENNRIFVGGMYQGSTDYDLQIAEMNTSGGIVWSRSYEFSLTNPHSIPTPNQTADCNWVNEMHVSGGELMVLTNATIGYGVTNGDMAGIMRIDINTGVNNSLHMFNQTFSHANAVGVDYLNPSHAYYVLNPTNQHINSLFPGPSSLSNPNDAVLSEIDPTTGGFTNAVQLLHDGSQNIDALDLLAGDTYYAGVSLGDPQQLGDHDIFYIKSPFGLPTEWNDCDILNTQLELDNPTVTDQTFRINVDQTYVINNPNISDYDEYMEAIILCQQTPPPPCDIEDMTWCGSLANPYQYTFNVATNPAGAVVEWDFGGTLVPSTGGTPVTHTFPGPGPYTVCVRQLDAMGDICDEECIEFCIGDNGAGMKPGKSMQSTDIVPVKNDNTTVGELFPNPTEGTLNIPVTTKLSSEDISVRIIRMDGVVVYDSKYTVETGKQILQVDMNNLVPGNYMCEIRGTDSKNVKVFTKN